jgi:hypothetical protein
MCRGCGTDGACTLTVRQTLGVAKASSDTQTAATVTPRPKVKRDRRALVVSAVVAVGLGLIVIGLSGGRTGNDDVRLPPAFLVLYPKPGELVLRQSEVGAKLQPGYRASMRIDDQDLPTYDVVANDSNPAGSFNQNLDARYDPGQGTLLFAPREGATIARFAPGEHRITIFYWAAQESREQAQTFAWSFKVS